MVTAEQEEPAKKPIKLKVLCGIVVFAVFAISSIPVFRHHLMGDTIDFHHFYRAAQSFRDGKDIYAVTKSYYIYPPLLAFLFQLLTLLPETKAAVAWMLISGTLILLAAIIASKESIRRWLDKNRGTDSSLVWIVTAVAIALAADKIRAVFSLGQNDGAMLLGFACVLRWMQRKPIAAGIAAGFTANVRYLSLIFVPYFLLKRNWRALIASLLSFGFFLLLPIVEVGWAQASHDAKVALGFVGRVADLNPPVQPFKMYTITWARSVSITSTMFRFTRSHGLSDRLAIELTVAIFVAAMAAVFFIARRHGVFLFKPVRPEPGPVSEMMGSLEWAVMIFVAMAFSPHTTARHMVLLLLLYTVSAGIFLAQTEKPPRIWLIAATALMAIGVSFPPDGIGIDQFVWTWRAIGAASWCAMIFTFTLVWVGTRTIRGKVKE